MSLSSTAQIAWRNLGRNRRRTALALGAIAVAELVLVFYESLFAGYGDQLVKSVTGPLVGHAQVHAPKWREDRAMDRFLPGVEGKLAAIRAVPGVEQAAARVYAPTLVARSVDGQAALVVGVDFATERQRGILDGIPLPPLPEKGGVLVGRLLADGLGAKAGDELALVGQASDGSVASGLFTVVAVVDTTVDLVNRVGLLMSLDDARELLVLPDAAHELVVFGSDPQAAGALSERLAALEPLAGAEVLGWRALAPEFASLIDLMWAYEAFILVLVFIAAAAGSANTMMMATFERTREFGMLLALGAKPRRIVSLVVTEGVLLGLLGLAAGALVGVSLVLITSRTGIDLSKLTSGTAESISFIGMKSSMTMFPRLVLGGLWRSLAAVLITSLLAALWPAVRAARLQPMEALRS
ncbi:MAG: FtsX-like permease family protein [Archangium sp.]|nr:FtsX-like permease family protein [Archangium sp.]